MRSLLQKTALITLTLVVVAACARKEPPAPPPPPPPAPVEVPKPTPAPVETTKPTPAPAPQFAPGSQQDLIATVGTDRVFFAYDSDALDSTSQDVLKRQAEWLAKNSSVRLTIEGHADERGTREYNIALGDRRAEAIKTFLVGNGVDGARLQTISYGKERPDAVGSNEESWAKNRRGVSVVRDANVALLMGR